MEVRYICGSCGEKYSLETSFYHCRCGGLFWLDCIPIVFDLDKVDKETWNIFRYRTFFALRNNLWEDIR